MADVLKVKEEPNSVVRELNPPEPPKTYTQHEQTRSWLTLERVANEEEKSRRLELLNAYLVQLSKVETMEDYDMMKDSNYMRKLIRSKENLVQDKVAELLLQYLKLLRLNTEYDPSLRGIRDSMLLLKLYQVVHDDACHYLLPNNKAGETFNKFLCNLLATSSSEYVFNSVVKLFQRTLDNVLSKYKQEGQPEEKNMTTEDARVVIGVMKTLLTLTQAFGAPPAPRELLCSVSVMVARSTNVHLCRSYSYSIASFLIRDVNDQETRNKLLKGLNEAQFNQIQALVKESNSLSDTCNWKFKYAPADSGRSQFTQVPAPSTTYSSEGSADKREESWQKKRNWEVTSTHSSYNNSNKGAGCEVSNQKAQSDSKKQKTEAFKELPNNWYKDLFTTFETNRGEGKSLVVDKNAWKWKNDALLKTLKMLEGVKGVEVEQVANQFMMLFENLFKYESAIPVVINSLNLFTLLLASSNYDFVSASKSQLLQDMLMEKMKDSNKKVREACVQALVEVVKRCKLATVAEGVKRALNNVSPNCRENMCNFLNGKVLSTSDGEFLEKLKQLLGMVSENVKQMTSDKVPKVRQAAQSVLEVTKDFSVIYANMSTNSTNSANNATDTNSTTNRSTNSTVYSTSANRGEFTGNKGSAGVGEVEEVVMAERRDNELEYTMTTTATSLVNVDTTSEFNGESTERETSTTYQKSSSVLEKLSEVLDKDVVNKFRSPNKRGLDEALYNLSLWMTDNPELTKSSDLDLLRLMNEFYPYFSNRVTLDMFFSTLFTQTLSDEAFSEVLKLLKNLQDLKVLNTLISKNNSNTKRLLNPLNNLYCSQGKESSKSNEYEEEEQKEKGELQSVSTQSSRATSRGSSKMATFVIKLLGKFVAEGSYELSEEALVKITNFLSYFVRVVSETTRVSLDLLAKLEEKYQVSKYLDHGVKTTLMYAKPSKNLEKEYHKSAERLEKYISKDLFMIMFKSNQDNKKRAAVFWKGFLSKRNEKSDDMMAGQGRRDLTSWLSYSLFENKCEKVVLEVMNVMGDHMSSRGMEFDAEESEWLTESFCSYSRFGMWQSQVLKVFRKVTECMAYSFETFKFVFDFVEKTSGQWTLVLWEQLVRLLKKSKGEEELVKYVSKRMETSKKITEEVRKGLKEWIESVSPPVVTPEEANKMEEDQLEESVVESPREQRVTESRRVGEEEEDKLVEVSMSEDSLRSKYSKDQSEKTKDWKEWLKKDEQNKSDSSFDVNKILEKKKETEKTYGWEELSGSDDARPELKEVKEVTNVGQKRKEEEQGTYTSGTVSSAAAERVALSSTSSQAVKVVMEALETVHQDDEHSMEPVSTADSTYDSRTNFPTTESFSMTQDSANVETSGNLDNERREEESNYTNNWKGTTRESKPTSEFNESSEVNQEKEKWDKYKEETSKSQPFEETLKNVRSELEVEVANEPEPEEYELTRREEYVEESKSELESENKCKEMNLLEQVILDEDVNVDVESCRRLSQQILDTPTTREDKTKCDGKLDLSKENENLNVNKEDKLSERDQIDKWTGTEEVEKESYERNKKDKKPYVEEVEVEVEVEVEPQSKFEKEKSRNELLKGDKEYEDGFSRKYDKDKAEYENGPETETVGRRYDKGTETEQNDPETTTSFTSRYDRQTETSSERKYEGKKVNKEKGYQSDQENWSLRVEETDSSTNYYERKKYMEEINEESKLLESNEWKKQKENKKNDFKNKKMKNLGNQNENEDDSYTKMVMDLYSESEQEYKGQYKEDYKGEYREDYREEYKEDDKEYKEEYELKLIETVISQCSRVNNACLVSSYKEYKKLAHTLKTEEVEKVCLESSQKVMKNKSKLKGSVLRTLEGPMVEMCHNGVLLLSKRVMKKVKSGEEWEETMEALSSLVEVFKVATVNLKDRFVLQFCNVVTNLLALPKDLFQNERLYCLVSSLVADNALKQTTKVMYKMLVVMVELSMESLEGELDRLLMAKLRFTKILQMQILLTLRTTGTEKEVNAEDLKSKHVDFIKRLEIFANRRTAHNVKRVIQTSNYLISTI